MLGSFLPWAQSSRKTGTQEPRTKLIRLASLDWTWETSVPDCRFGTDVWAKVHPFIHGPRMLNHFV